MRQQTIVPDASVAGQSGLKIMAFHRIAQLGLVLPVLTIVACSPEQVIKRLEGAKDQKAEGKRLCIDIINEIKEIAGVSGVHVMAYRQEEYVAEIVDESGVLKGRRPWKRELARDTQTIADRLDHILHDDITETQTEMVKAGAH